jgi:hypothetical protein
MKHTSATGFIRWQTLFEKEVNEPKPEHFYFAEMSSEIACLPFLVWGKKPPDELRDPKTYMLKFGSKEEIESKSEAAAKQRAEHDAQFSESTWATFLGIEFGPDGKPIKKERPTEGQPRKLPAHIRQAGDVLPGGSAYVPTAVSPAEGQILPPNRDFSPKASVGPKKQRPKVVIRGGIAQGERV